MAFSTGNETVRMSGSPEGRGGMVMRGGPTGATKMTMGPTGLMHMEIEKMPMEGFATMLSRFLDRPVVDMTDLKGNFQVAIDLSRDDMMSAARSSGMGMVVAGAQAGAPPTDAASDPSGGSIFTSVQQLGLKLDPRKSPVQRIIIDHLEKTPTEN